MDGESFKTLEGRKSSIDRIQTLIACVGNEGKFNAGFPIPLKVNVILSSREETRWLGGEYREVYFISLARFCLGQGRRAGFGIRPGIVILTNVSLIYWYLQSRRWPNCVQ